MYTRLHPVKLGLAGGILCGVTMALLTLLVLLSGHGVTHASQWIHLFPGYDFSWKGVLIILFYGFIKGFIGLFVLAWLYNLLKP